MIYTVTLNPALDHTVFLDTLHPGAVNRAGSERLDPGGKGINVSVILHRLGMPSVALGFRAGATGAMLEELIQGLGCTAELIAVPGMTRVNTKLKADAETDINCPGPEIPPEAFGRLLGCLDRLQDGDALVLAGSVPPSAPADIYAQMLARTGGRRVLTVVDAEGPLLRHTLPYRPFLIKPNREELEMLFGRKLTGLREIESCAEQLQRAGARHVIVSLGAEGAFLLAEDGARMHLPVPPGRTVNAVGAGDSMVAGFLYRYQQTGDCREAFRFSVCCGSATAFQPGLAERSQIFQLASTYFPGPYKWPDFSQR